MITKHKLLKYLPLFFGPISFASIINLASCNLNKAEILGLGDSLTELSNYGYYVSENLKFNGWKNYGICGSTISEIGTDPFIYRYQNMYHHAKIIIVDGGYNDWQFECPLGTKDDAIGNTFYGALNILIPGLQSIYTNSWIFFMTPFYYSDRIEGLTPYINAILDRCSFYHMDCFNIFTPTFPFNYIEDTEDGVHPTQTFTREKWVPAICEYIQLHYKN